MQGKNTEKSIIKAINKLESIEGVDVIVITRGGGSIAELSCFDSEPIANTIANCKLPVLSGIGHEINTTVTDLAAHTFAKTPTAIAKYLVDRLREFIDGVDERQDRLILAIKDSIDGQRRRLKDNAILLQTQTLGLIKSHQQHLGIIANSLNRSPLLKFKEGKQSLGESTQRLKKIIHLHLQNSRTKINQYQQLVQMADPKNTLKRGFSITRTKEGKIIRSIEDVGQVKIITTELVDGILNSEVKI
jgi:exodeoxyribonuclease VII large subunit